MHTPLRITFQNTPSSDAIRRLIEEQADEYQRKLRRLCRILTDTGFLAADKPTDKGLLAARVYGENTLLVTEAVWQGWLDGLRPPELATAVSPDIEWVLQVMDGRDEELFSILRPTSPFRTAATIRR